MYYVLCSVLMALKYSASSPNDTCTCYTETNVFEDGLFINDLLPVIVSVYMEVTSMYMYMYKYMFMNSGLGIGGMICGKGVSCVLAQRKHAIFCPSD